MNEITEMQVKALSSMMAVVVQDGVLKYSNSVGTEIYIVDPSIDKSPLSEILSANGTSGLSGADVYFIFEVLLRSEVNIAAVIHDTLRKYAQSINEPMPVVPDIPAEFASEFGGYDS